MKTSERLLNASKTIWDAYNEHPFVLGIQNGTLERDKFRYYIMQDFLYLKDYAKTYAVGVAKAKSVETANLFAKYINVMNGELDVHKGYMGKFAVTQEEIGAMKPSLDNLSYTSYMIRVAYDESEVELLAAVLSCAYSYEVIAKKQPLFEKSSTKNVRYTIEDNFFTFWFRFIYKYSYMLEIENYESVKTIINRDYETFSGLMLERYFRRVLIERQAYTRIGGWWDRKGENEIDIVAENELDEEATFFEVKRKSDNIDMKVLENKAAAFLRATGEFKGYKISYKGLSMDDM